jgi:hypothetical protein
MLPAVMIALVLGAGCGNAEDPTAPREVRTIEPVEAPATSEPAAQARDEQSPTKGIPCAAQLDAGEKLALCGAATDNYKASFNADPDVPERRTWLAAYQLQVGDVRWQPVDGAALASDELAFERVDGEPGSLQATVEIIDGPGSSVQLRSGPQRGLWGPLLTIDSVDTLRDAPVTVRVVARDDEGSEQTADVTYRFDEVLAAAPASSLEHNGPGGRWHVAGIATTTNLELGWE